MVVFNLTIVRHGETQHNKDLIIQGQMDIPLSCVGKQQALLVGHRLKNELFSHVYSSDLCRATETTKCILKKNQHVKPCIITDSRLRERKFGVMEGKPVNLLRATAKNVSMKVRSFTPSGAETLKQVHERAVSFFQELCISIIKEASEKEENPEFCPTDISKVCRGKKSETENSHQQLASSKQGDINCDKQTKDGKISFCDQSSESLANILVVSHGGFIGELIRYLFKDLKCSLPGGKKDAFKFSPNASVSKFVINAKNLESIQINCTYIHDKRHLDECNYNSSVDNAF